MRLRNIPGAQDAILESPYVVQEPQTKKGHWAEVFAKKQPLHIEVGMGKGRFLMDLARLHPEINYVGIEMYDSVLLRALQKREELEQNGEVYSNLFFMRVDARLLPDIFEKGEVDNHPICFKYKSSTLLQTLEQNETLTLYLKYHLKTCLKRT